MDNKKYTYQGAVYAFGSLVATKWEASTWAPSEAKAVSNLKHRFRQFAGIVGHTPITFSGKIVTS